MREPHSDEATNRVTSARALDTMEKIAKWDPEKMQQMFAEFVERKKFDGTPPTSFEAAFTVKLAKYLPRIVEY